MGFGQEFLKTCYLVLRFDAKCILISLLLESLSGGMVDAEDLKSSDRKIVRVQVPSRAPVPM